MTIYDGRDPQMPKATVRLACGRHLSRSAMRRRRTPDQIRAALADAKRERPFSEDDLTEALSILTSRRILYEERGKYFHIGDSEHPYY